MRLLPFISRRYLAVIAVALALIMSVLDGTIVNVALPTLSREFGISPSSTIWVVNAYQLTVTMLLLSFSALGDIYGYRRIFLFGTGLFTATSLLCALSGSFPMLVIARIAQGIGAAAIMGVTTALMRIIFPPEHIGRGMSINAMVVAVSIAAGPSIAGLILSFASWHWLFAINLPLGVCAITAGYLLLPENPSRQTPIRRKFDKLGGVCSALTFGLLIYSLEGIAHDENRWLVLIQLLLLLAIGTFFIRRERHEETPILPLDLLRIPIFALSVIASIASFTAQMLAMIAHPFFLQNIAGRSEVETGLLMTPWPVATVLTAPIAGRLVERFHPGILGGIGMALYSLGLLLLVFLPSEPTNGELAWRLAICGIGFGLFQTPNNSTMMSAAPAYRSGGANGMQGTARLLGQTTGTTLVALIFRLIHGTNPLPTCLTLAIGFAVVAGITSVCRLSQPTPIRKRH